YIFKNSSGTVIYIGKAKSIKKRAGSYFSNTKKDIKTNVLSSLVADIDFIVTKNELEAFLLENSLIKEHKPRYNIMLKDDKSYPYIQVTAGEKYPGVYVTRSLKDKKSVYYGPYYALDAKRVVQAIYSIFRVRQCTYGFDSRPLKRPCIYYDTAMCSAPCVRFITDRAYFESVDEVRRFLRGEYKSAVRHLEKEMRVYSAKKQYEKAARARDAIAAVKSIMEEQKVVDSRGKDLDIIDFAATEGVLYVCVLNIRSGRLINKRMEKFNEAAEGGRQFENFFYQYYTRNIDEPGEIILPAGSIDRAAAAHVLGGKKTKITFSKAGRLLLMARENIRERIKADKKQVLELEKRAEEYRSAALMLKKRFNLAAPPQVIDGIDISHLHGEHTAASAVVFKNGLPDKNLYRRYKIRSVKNIDDYESIREAVKRRYGRMLKEDIKFPDLILIDGGIGQVNGAKEALELTGLDIPVIGLAKREELVFVPGENRGIELEAPAKHLLMRIRDEAHRFAVSYQFLLANRKLIKTVFDGIDFIGEKTKQMIYDTFRDTDSLLNALENNDERAAFLNNRQKESLIKALKTGGKGET
ncbi:MAG TPA: excinuclease ABC subunit UvrC, partial [bacterium]|nr:excinuclease ABC subunit UvrC [bacterium]